MTIDPRLDATLCFVKIPPPSAISSEKDEEDNDEDEDNEEEENNDDDDDDDDDDDGNPWKSGDVGGFECYIEAEDNAHETAASAEVKQLTVCLISFIHIYTYMYIQMKAAWN